MGPLHVERDLFCPTHVGRGKRGASALVLHFETRRGNEAKRRVKDTQIVRDVRVVVGIHNGNGLSGAGPLDGAKRNLIKPVSLSHLGRGITVGDGRSGERLDSGWATSEFTLLAESIRRSSNGSTASRIAAAAQRSSRLRMRPLLKAGF